MNIAKEEQTTMTFNVSTDLKLRLKILAKHHEMTMTDLVVSAIDTYPENRENKAAAAMISRLNKAGFPPKEFGNIMEILRETEVRKLEYMNNPETVDLETFGMLIDAKIELAKKNGTYGNPSLDAIVKAMIAIADGIRMDESITGISVGGVKE